MTLPLLISLPHAGLWVPEELRDICLLSEDEIIADGDEGAAEIYAIADEVAAFITTDAARAVIDMNRAEDDIRKDGVVKTHTCWDVPIWSRPLTGEETTGLIEAYHRPFHCKLSEAATDNIRLGIDCHTMAAFGPPVGPDHGQKRPLVCLGNGNGETCPDDLFQAFADSFRKAFGDDVSLNEPFSGGYTIRFHARELAWVQLEMSRTDTVSAREKKRLLLEALNAFASN